MKYLLLLAIAAVLAGFVLPAKQEGTADVCAALDKRVHAMVDAEIAKLPQSSDPKVQAAIAEAKTRLPTAATIGKMVRETIPMLPPEAGCAAGYWTLVFKPDLLRPTLPDGARPAR